MLSPSQKAGILRRTGIEVPCPPEALEGIDLAGAPSDESPALLEWNAAVERLFVGYAAARAAKSLRDAEEARQLDRLRRMAAMPARELRDRHAEWA